MLYWCESYWCGSELAAYVDSTLMEVTAVVTGLYVVWHGYEHGQIYECPYGVNISAYTTTTIDSSTVYWSV